MKIVVNECFGGFNLSEDATARNAKASLLSTATLRRYWPSVRMPCGEESRLAPRHLPPHRAGWRRTSRLRAAGLTDSGSCTGVRGAMSIMAVMLVPIAAVGQQVDGSLQAPDPPALRRLRRGRSVRFRRPCGSSDRRRCRGRIGRRHLENGDHSHRYVGTQFALAVLITLVKAHLHEIECSMSWNDISS